MPLISDDALVLDRIPFRDRHLLLTLLTRSSGLVRGVLRRARGGKAPLAAAAQILSLVHVTGFSSPRAELATFHELDLLRSSYALASDLGRSAAAAVMADLLATFCPPGEPAPRRFRLGVAVLDGLVAGATPAVAVAYAEFWILQLSGVLPEIVSAEFGDDDREFLESCRTRPLGQLPPRTPEAAAAWLDRQVRREAERPLHALDFFRSQAV